MKENPWVENRLLPRMFKVMQAFRLRGQLRVYPEDIVPYLVLNGVPPRKARALALVVLRLLEKHGEVWYDWKTGAWRVI